MPESNRRAVIAVSCRDPGEETRRDSPVPVATVHHSQIAQPLSGILPLKEPCFPTWLRDKSLQGLFGGCMEPHIARGKGSSEMIGSSSSSGDEKGRVHMGIDQLIPKISCISNHIVTTYLLKC